MEPAIDRVNFTLKEEIRDYWSARATTFDSSPSHKIEDKYGIPEWHALLRQAFNLGADKDLAGMRALDIACGTGEVSRTLCGFGAEVTAVDFSEEMLLQATTKMSGKKWTGVLADAEFLQLLPDGYFDVAVTRHLVWTLTDPSAAFREWRRVLKPGGRLLVIDGDWTAKKSWLLKLRHWLARTLDGGGYPGSNDIARHRAIQHQLFYADGLTIGTLEAALLSTGFSQCTELPIGRLYGAGMRGAKLSDRLRLTASNRFALVAS